MASAPPPPPGGPPLPPGGYPPPGYPPQMPYAQVPFNQVPYVPAGPVPGLQYAGFWIRVASYLIDVLPLAIAAGILSVSWGTGYRCGFDAYNTYQCSTGTGSLGSWLAVLVLGVYWVLTWSLMGASLGQKALGLRVVNAQNGERIDIGKAVIRYIGFVVSSIPLFLGLIWAGFDPRKQGWHDKIAGTYVVRPV